MPRKKKPAKELTTEEAMRKMFPNKALRDAKKDALSPAKTSINRKDK
jgi:hypothetical protein